MELPCVKMMVFKLNVQNQRRLKYAQMFGSEQWNNEMISCNYLKCHSDRTK